MENLINELLKVTPKDWNIGHKDGLKNEWRVSWCYEVDKEGELVFYVGGKTKEPINNRYAANYWRMAPEEINNIKDLEELPAEIIELFKIAETNLNIN